MKRMLPILVMLLVSACAHLAPIQPADGQRRSPIEARCRSYFPKGRWQLVHTIDARLPGGRRAIFTGVIVLSAADASIHCVLMTLEGLVLFEAVDDGRVSVRRAVGPFDNAAFAKGVMDDLRFLFFKPAGGILTAGRFEDGRTGCRCRGAHHRIVDLMQTADGGWQMKAFDQRGHTLRSATAAEVDANGNPHRLVLEAGGRRGYRLTMTLLEAVRLKQPSRSANFSPEVSMQ